jgi:tRNA(fMet)-specific endonuclease VapC
MAEARYLLDTNICIRIRRGRPQGVPDRFRALALGSAAITVITYGGLFYGARIQTAAEVEDLD